MNSSSYWVSYLLLFSILLLSEENMKMEQYLHKLLPPLPLSTFCLCLHSLALGKTDYQLPDWVFFPDELLNTRKEKKHEGREREEEKKEEDEKD